MADNKVNSGLLEFSEDQKVFVALDAETSEVKKAVTIDGDGVETDIQGVQPSGKKEITTTAEVNVASYATAQVVDEDLVAGNIKKDVDILGVVGSYEPEAPASDFSTATLTLTKGGPNVGDLYAPFLMAYPAGTSLFPIIPDVEGTNTYEVVVYSGGTALIYIGSNTVTISGDIQAMGGGNYLITGDCTITISAANS